MLNALCCVSLCVCLHAGIMKLFPAGFHGHRAMSSVLILVVDVILLLRSGLRTLGWVRKWQAGSGFASTFTNSLLFLSREA